MYSMQKFGQELMNLLNQPHDAIKIARWAEHIYTYHCRELSDELDDVVTTLSFMELGPEFVYTDKELRLLAEFLIKEQKNPLKKIKDMEYKGDR